MSYSQVSRYVKLAAVFAGTVAVRFLPWRPPNVEPILATTIPVSGVYGPVISAMFAALNIALYDGLTSGWGRWTLVAALAYAAVGLAACFFMRLRRPLWQQLIFVVIATIAYDFVTGVLAGSLLFAMPWYQALVGQVPFTINHVIGTLVLTAAISPLLSRWFSQSTHSVSVPVGTVRA